MSEAMEKEKLVVGDVNKLEVFINEIGELVGVCFEKDGCTHLFGEAVFFDVETEFVNPEYGIAMVAH